jgi:hypothetical protein
VPWYSDFNKWSWIEPYFSFTVCQDGLSWSWIELNFSFTVNVVDVELFHKEKKTVILIDFGSVGLS